MLCPHNFYLFDYPNGTGESGSNYWLFGHVWSWYRIAGTATALLAGQSGGDQEWFSSVKCPEWLLGPPDFLFSEFRGSFLGVKRQGPYADHSSPSSAVYKD
jgi:hypothetical protein